MIVINIMLSKQQGGIEQAFLNYSQMLKSKGLKVYNVTSRKCAKEIAEVSDYTLTNLNQFDLFSIWQLRRIIKNINPSIIICHGYRSIKFAYYSQLYINIPIIAVAHNYNIRLLEKCNYIFAPTNHLVKFLERQNFKNKIFYLPNIITFNTEYLEPKLDSKHVRIGALGRFVEKKGFHIFIEALAILKKDNIKFDSFIAGKGPEFDLLKRLVDKFNLIDEVKFCGWIYDKEKFFREIDIFCLPSLHEPFGIVVLEAMAYSTPIVSSKVEGPSEIIRHNQDGLLFTPDSPKELAESIKLLIASPKLTVKLTNSAYQRVYEKYGIHTIAGKLLTILKTII